MLLCFEIFQDPAVKYLPKREPRRMIGNNKPPQEIHSPASFSQLLKLDMKQVDGPPQRPQLVDVVLDSCHLISTTVLTLKFSGVVSQ
jgi:hypothetical protein